MVPGSNTKSLAPPVVLLRSNDKSLAPAVVVLRSNVKSLAAPVVVLRSNDLPACLPCMHVLAGNDKSLVAHGAGTLRELLRLHVPSKAPTLAHCPRGLAANGAHTLLMGTEVGWLCWGLCLVGTHASGSGSYWAGSRGAGACGLEARVRQVLQRGREARKSEVPRCQGG